MGEEDEKPSKPNECAELEDADARELCEQLSRDLEIATNAERTPNSSPAADDADATTTTSSTGPKDEA
ncbi:MAG: hypothetical protein V7609_3045 [Verrucomicrobiota bacterium]